MQAFFSSEGPLALQFLVIFVVILVLLLIAALLFVRLSGRGLTLSAGAGQRGRQPRLGIVDIYELDRQRQLILLRRDNVEHLLLVGGPNDVVVERHIQRGAGSRYAAEGHARSGEIGAVEPGGIETPRTDPFFDSPMPPTFAMPEVVPAAVPGAPPVTDRAAPLDPGLFEPEISPADAPPRPATPVSRLMRRTAPPVVSPRPETASERTLRPEPAAAASAPEAAPVMASREPRAVDPAVLSDMARQLQVALKRPSSAVTPPPGGTGEAPPSPPAPKPGEPLPPRPDPIAAAMAASRPAEPARSAPSAAVPPPPSVRPEPAPAAVPSPPASEPKPEPGPEPKPASAAKPVAPPQFVAPSRPEPAKSEPVKSEATRPEPARAEPPKPEPPKAEAPEPAGQGQNPFSVEEIEAEFARLLGRPLDSKS
ncbi:trans-sialidase [Methylorubrum populi]|uniref:Trans-sialidase n=1 Tax=Methylorubrum populi TaxID=223967 RepID=A0A160PGS6_9HYPH|nr:hypothetical protein [Methylorubrum populi]BAU91503.1 trans-sialidase [Methylorubrum populi]